MSATSPFFHLKIEISTRPKPIETAVLSLRGVPVTTLEPSFLMTEKLVTFVDRHAGRDLFDAWFILQHGFALNDALIKEHFGDYRKMYEAIMDRLESADTKRILRDTGKLLDMDHRNWIKIGFLGDFKRMVRGKLDRIQKKNI